jgi:adenosylmethionine-8-amino-7-oxononanoate aminotransferase
MPDLQPDWLSLDHVWLPYTPMATASPPLPVVGARGARLRLANGRELIDGISSWWTLCHGHNHPALCEAIRAQTTRLSHVMFAGLAHEPAYVLARRLAALLPQDLDHVFFAESGSVSVEIALKIALQYWQLQGMPRRQFLSFRHGYHGDTFMTMALTDPALALHAAYQGLTPQALQADLPRDDASTATLDALLERQAPQLAAVIVEPLVQGAGGFIIHTPSTLARLRALCDRHKLILIADEIMTGFGRTGAFFAHKEARITPDIVCLGKALSGGMLPLAATVVRSSIYKTFQAAGDAGALMHGPTFMANPLACAAALASLDLFEREPRQRQILAIQSQLLRGLQPCVGLPGVVRVRVKGAIGVVELDGPTASLRAAFVQRGVWLRPFGRVISVLPPFIIDPDDLDRVLRAIVDVVKSRPPAGSSASDAFLHEV